MGDDTPTPARARIDRPVVDHLRQAFAQVTNPPIDPERERAVMDLRVELGRRPALLGGIPAAPRTIRLDRPVVADLDGIAERIGRRHVRWLDATWRAADGPAGLADALDAPRGRRAARRRDGLGRAPRHLRPDDVARPPAACPSVLAVGAVHTALGAAGLRGRADLVVDAADVLDVHGLAMAVAAGATAVRPRLAIELAAELAGSRGAETLTAAEAVRHLLEAFEAGLRKTLARMGISAVASYVGGALFETLELAPEVVERCFPSAAAWPGRIGFEALAERGLRRLDAGRALAAAGDGVRLADPGLARFRADGELHLYAPVVVKALQAVADGSSDDLRTVPGRDPAVVRDGLRIHRPRGTKPVPLDEVEPARSIARRFVASAMSVGALSPEAHQAVTIGMQRAGGAANTGEGGEDPAWYRPTPSGERHDARIKQVASARFGVTATYLARADQLEIKIAQGSKPGEGGQLPGQEGDGRDRGPPPRPAGPVAHQPAAPPRHLLDRGPRPAHRRPPGDQPAGPDRGQARRQPRRRHDRRGRGQGRGRLRPPVRPRRRDRGQPAQLDQARRGAVGARSRRGPPDAPPQRPPRPGRPADRRRAPGRPRRPGRGPARGRGVRVRDRDARRARLRHGQAVPPRHLPDRDRHPASRPAGEVHGDARAGRAIRPGRGRGPSPRARRDRRPLGRRDRRRELGAT